MIPILWWDLSATSWKTGRTSLGTVDNLYRNRHWIRLTFLAHYGWDLFFQHHLLVWMVSSRQHTSIRQRHYIQLCTLSKNSLYCKGIGSFLWFTGLSIYLIIQKLNLEWWNGTLNTVTAPAKIKHLWSVGCCPVVCSMSCALHQRLMNSSASPMTRIGRSACCSPLQASCSLGELQNKFLFCLTEPICFCCLQKCLH